MRDYGRVHCTFWSSSNVRALSDDGRTLALYLLTSPHTTLVGAFRLPDGYVSEDMHWTSARVAKGFEELFRNGFANRCETTKWVWICKFLEWNAPENPNQWKSARKIAAQIPDECAWKREFLRALVVSEGGDPGPQPNPSVTVSEPLRNQEQEQEQEQEQKKDSPPLAVEREFHKGIVASYHAALPDLPAVKVWNDRRRGKLRKRIEDRCKEGKPADTAEYWTGYFAKVARSDFLCGRGGVWRADFEWLIEAENFDKVIEGRYDNNTNGATHGRSYASASTAALS